jgi:hypothetical protein
VKAVFGSILIVCLILPVVGVWLHFGIEKASIQAQVKHTIKQGLPKSALTRFEFTPNEIAQLEWEHAKEFTHKGMKYDVVQTKKRGNVTILWCWKDHQESALYEKVKSLIASALIHHEERNDTKRFAQFYKSLFWQEVKPVISFRSAEAFLYGQNESCLFDEVLLTLDTPPPRPILS